ncbi:MAG TPA: SpoIID/LytB domain-containing protein [Thermoleophilaceae bacterium]|jgi:stage II sporulation protein D
MRRIVLVLIAALALPAAADAAVRHVVRGAGFGHGIGMSQYGAYGYALNGARYEGILEHYYKGTTLTDAPGAPVRVLLQPNDPYIRFVGASAAGGKRVRSRTTYVARRSGSGIVLRTAAGRLVGRFGSAVTVKRSGGDPVRLLGPALNGVTSGSYRGAIEIRVDGGVTAINVIPLDPYVKGVVAGEMPSSWPLEALKAQAVAARTYALATRKTGSAFDQYPDTRSQVYRGVTGESVRSNAAVDDTAGQILEVGGVPAVTYYHSTSGGHTENVENSFIGALSHSWLVGVPDPYDNQSPYHRWRVRFTTGQLTSDLSGYVRGTFRKLKVLKRGVSPRIVRARVYGTRGTSVISGPTLRARLGLRDTWARFTRISSTARSPRSARPAAWGAAPTARLLVGSFQPAPRGHELRLERRTRGVWRTLLLLHTARDGHYRAALDRAGVYRVRSGKVAGPAVRVR